MFSLLTKKTTNLYTLFFCFFRFEKMEYKEKIIKAKNVGQMFNIVKKLVKDYTGLQKTGISVGLENIEMYNGHFIGGLYNYKLNKLIVNKIPLKFLINKNPDFHNFYLFHILLHEYIHAVGFMDEVQTREVVFQITRDCFGDNHLLTHFALNLGKFLPKIYPTPEQVIYINKPANVRNHIPSGFDFGLFKNFDKIIDMQFRQMQKMFERFIL